MYSVGSKWPIFGPRFPPGPSAWCNASVVRLLLVMPPDPEPGDKMPSKPDRKNDHFGAGIIYRTALGGH